MLMVCNHFLSIGEPLNYSVPYVTRVIVPPLLRPLLRLSERDAACRNENSGDPVPRAVYCEDGSLEILTLLVTVFIVEVWCLKSWVEVIPAKAFQALRLFSLHVIAMKMQGHNTIIRNLCDNAIR